MKIIDLGDKIGWALFVIGIFAAALTTGLPGTLGGVACSFGGAILFGGEMNERHN